MQLLSFAALAAIAGVSYGHMAMIKPCPFFSPNCETQPPALPAGASYDYNIKNPIAPDGPLMKTNLVWPAPVETWTAGEDVTIKFQKDGAAHGGGHLAISISFDGGKTSVMVFQRLRYAFFNGPSSSNTPEVLEYTFKLPADVPSCDNVVVSQTWVNAIGNREWYRDDSLVSIKGSTSATSFTGPQMVIANHNGYPTIPEFNGNYDTGVDLYENAPIITIYANGGSSTGSSPSAAAPDYSSAVTSSAAAPDYSTAAPPVAHTPAPSPTAEAGKQGSAAPSPASPAPVSSAPVSSAPVPVPTGSACTHGAMRCASGNGGFQQCVWGVWSAVTSCAAGTVCQQSSADAIICNWP
ncbi:hypothetical protein IWW55_004960 [Coemansia sp. RSA 2706]|nr:hypothetical protein IWW55_004960 [Coemansia sp. RSA 2706]